MYNGIFQICWFSEPSSSNRPQMTTSILVIRWRLHFISLLCCALGVAGWTERFLLVEAPLIFLGPFREERIFWIIRLNTFAQHFCLFLLWFVSDQNYRILASWSVWVQTGPNRPINKPFFNFCHFWQFLLSLFGNFVIILDLFFLLCFRSVELIV